MTINTNILVSITEVNQNFSKVSKAKDETSSSFEHILSVSKRIGQTEQIGKGGTDKGINHMYDN